MTHRWASESCGTWPTIVRRFDTDTDPTLTGRDRKRKVKRRELTPHSSTSSFFSADSLAICFYRKISERKVNFELRRVGQSATDWVASGPPNGHLSVCCRRRGGRRAVYLSPLKGETKNVVDLSAADPRSAQEYQEERKVVGRWRRKKNKWMTLSEKFQAYAERWKGKVPLAVAGERNFPNFPGGGRVGTASLHPSVF